MLSYHQPYTMNELAQVTGLSAYQIKESNRILKDCEIFVTSRAYANYERCIGNNVDMNHEAFYQLPQEE